MILNVDSFKRILDTKFSKRSLKERNLAVSESANFADRFIQRSPKRGQMKIQQMAFVLVALMIFFAIVGLFYFAVRFSNLEGDVTSLREEEARESVRKLVGTSEFTHRKCANCLDLDKAFVLKDSSRYEGFWKLDYLQIEILGEVGECTRGNYPDCGTITIIDEGEIGSAVSSFVALCRYEDSLGGYTKCEIGRILVSGEGIR